MCPSPAHEKGSTDRGEHGNNGDDDDDDDDDDEKGIEGLPCGEQEVEEVRIMSMSSQRYRSSFASAASRSENDGVKGCSMYP
jgi:hypothetical protein